MSNSHRSLTVDYARSTLNDAAVVLALVRFGIFMSHHIVDQLSCRGGSRIWV